MDGTEDSLDIEGDDLGAIQATAKIEAKKRNWLSVWLEAHVDNDYSYLCGNDYCRCLE